MPKYKIVETEKVVEIEKESPVELRLVMDGSFPQLQARNPGEGWHIILFLDMQGRAALFGAAKNVKGITTDKSNHIVTY